MANLTLDKLKTIVQSIVASVTRYKPNLSVNDPDDPRYVAGRLCYKTTKTVEEVPETTVTFAENNGLYVSTEMLPMPGVQAIGDVRTVVWDGVAYVCKTGLIQNVAYTLGNLSLFNGLVEESYPDTGEPFLWGMMPQQGIAMLVTKDTAETHTVSCWADKEVVHTLPKEYLPQIPADKLPDLGLAAVATSGSYNDLSDKPTIPTVPSDIVRYNTTQSLTDTQKTRARTNIGAGTSSFDGAYSSLTGAPTLAAVATSGAYEDLSDAEKIPYEQDEITYGMVVEEAEVGDNWCVCKTKNIYDFDDVFETYRLPSFNYSGENNTVTIYNKQLDGEGNRINKITVNGKTYTGKGVAVKSGVSYLVSFDGYICVTNKTISSPNYFYFGSHSSPIAVKKLKMRESVIPSTIQRVGEPLYLTDTAGAKWQLVVGEDGALSTTAVTE